MVWLRIATAGVVFAVWRQPSRFLGTLQQRDGAIVVSLGVVLAAMNTVFYEAIARLPLATVGAIEFLGPIAIAAWGVRTRRNLAALALAVFGGCLLTEVRIVSEPLGYEFAFLNCILFMIYVLLGHRIAIGGEEASGVDRLAAAMLIATAVAVPTGLRAALPAFTDPVLLATTAGVGVSSSVVPHVCGQLAMRRLPRASFALLLALLPISAACVGIVVLRQVPSMQEALGVLPVIGGVALHRSLESN